MEDKNNAVSIGIVAAVELAKLALQLYFRAMEMAGKTAEEMETLYQGERLYFVEHHPSTLPDMEAKNG